MTRVSELGFLEADDSACRRWVSGGNPRPARPMGRAADLRNVRRSSPGEQQSLVSLVKSSGVMVRFEWLSLSRHPAEPEHLETGIHPVWRHESVPAIMVMLVRKNSWDDLVRIPAQIGGFRGSPLFCMGRGQRRGVSWLDESQRAREDEIEHSASHENSK